MDPRETPIGRRDFGKVVAASVGFQDRSGETVHKVAIVAEPER